MQPDLALALFTVAVLIFSIIIHEVAHGYAALQQGDVTAKYAGRLTLNPSSHIDSLGSVIIPGMLVLTGASFLFGWARPVPYNPDNLRNKRWGEAFVAIAGVATNLFLAVVFAIIVRAALAAGMTSFADLAATVVLVNLFLGLFNLLPFPPFDGFSFLRSALPASLSYRLRLIEDMALRGGILALVMVLVVFSLFLSGPFSALVGRLFSLLVGG
jgi:Zn-dependent protease